MEEDHGIPQAVRRPLRRPGWRLIGALPCCLLLLIGAGCASRPPAENPDALAAFEARNDPLEPFNRAMFAVNETLDMFLLRPAAEIYRGVLPVPVRSGVRNFVNNVEAPVTLANDLLQGQWERAGVTATRFSINSTAGLLGVLDPASELGYEWHDEDFGQSLAIWGVEEGPYLVLPLLGPRPPRDALGWVGDQFLDPLTYVFWGSDSATPYALAGADLTDFRSRNIERLDEIERSSLDFYVSIRSMYRQQRNFEIANRQVSGKEVSPLVPPAGAFEFEDDETISPGL